LYSKDGKARQFLVVIHIFSHAVCAIVWGIFSGTNDTIIALKYRTSNITRISRVIAIYGKRGLHTSWFPLVCICWSDTCCQNHYLRYI